jgi:hypothetical protein
MATSTFTALDSFMFDLLRQQKSSRALPLVSDDHAGHPHPHRSQSQSDETTTASSSNGQKDEDTTSLTVDELYQVETWCVAVPPSTSKPTKKTKRWTVTDDVTITTNVSARSEKSVDCDDDTYHEYYIDWKGIDSSLLPPLPLRWLSPKQNEEKYPEAA